MQARDFMTELVHCGTPDMPLRDAAKLMAERDLGCLPIVSDQDSRKLIGMLTDRDITVRTLGQNRNPWEMTVGQCMTAEIFTAHPDTSEEALCQLMEDHQVRRVPVVDDENICHGIVSLADIARKGSEHETFAVVRDISRAKAL